MKRVIIVILVGLIACGPAFGWGREGHETIAKIAENHLKPSAKKKIEKYLGGYSIVHFAKWMDDYRHTPEYKFTTTWHTAPVDASLRYDEALLDPKKGNAIYGLEGAIKALENGQVVIFGCGLGAPYFSTDTAAVLRAAEIEADAVLMAKNIDGIYSADPKKDPNAVRFDTLTFDKALELDLKVMDAAAFSLCRDNKLAIIVFDFAAPDSIERAVSGDTSCGTIVS